MSRRAVFLDKDGTLIPDIPYNVDPGRIQLYPDAGLALQQLHGAGYQLLVISNQAGVARGYFAETALPAVADRLQALLAEFQVSLSGFYYCPHHPAGTVPEYTRPCACRKPAPGLLLQAAAEHQLSLPDSWMIGDILNDVEAGNRAGCRTILLDRGHETEWLPGDFRTPSFTVRSLAEAAAVILAHAGNVATASSSASSC